MKLLKNKRKEIREKNDIKTKIINVNKTYKRKLSKLKYKKKTSKREIGKERKEKEKREKRRKKTRVFSCRCNVVDLRICV